MCEPDHGMASDVTFVVGNLGPVCVRPQLYKNASCTFVVAFGEDHLITRLENRPIGLVWGHCVFHFFTGSPAITRAKDRPNGMVLATIVSPCQPPK